MVAGDSASRERLVAGTEGPDGGQGRGENREAKKERERVHEGRGEGGGVVGTET